MDNAGGNFVKSRSHHVCDFEMARTHCGQEWVKQHFAASGIEIAAMPATEFAAYIKSELAKGAVSSPRPASSSINPVWNVTHTFASTSRGHETRGRLWPRDATAAGRRPPS